MSQRCPSPFLLTAAHSSTCLQDIERNRRKQENPDLMDEDDTDPGEPIGAIFALFFCHNNSALGPRPVGRLVHRPG